jgi:hypothetical protein
VTTRLPGDPVPTANPDHQPVVPPFNGMPPWCTCGWRSARHPRPGEFLADHLREHDPTYGQAATDAPEGP